MIETQRKSWCPVLAPGQVVTAVTTALEVAARLREDKRIEAAVVAAAQQTAFPRSVHWQPYGIAQGYAGLAIMCGYLDACFPNQNWDASAHRCLEKAIRDAEVQCYLPTGMFAGLSGLAFAAWYLSRGGERYRKLLAAIEGMLLPLTVAHANGLVEQKKEVSFSQFDLISGLSGVGEYLLCRREDPGAVATLRAVLSSLVELTKEEAGLPRWYTPAHLLGDEDMQRLYPNGSFNCGLAHGIPGPLALLSLAHISGIAVDGMENAIHRAATWLLQHRLDDTWGINWPSMLRLEDDGKVSTEPALPFEPGRTAWCYGSPGLARSLWFAGQALDNAEYREIAVAAMEAVFRRPLYVRRIDSPTFCHGVSGLMQITLRFAHDTRLPQFTQAAQALSKQLFSSYDPDRPLGYYSLEPGGNRVDQPGLLDGVPGVVLVLLAAATPVEPVWDRLFLLS
jgi:lantibiotic biosynthesis protein